MAIRPLFPLRTAVLLVLSVVLLGSQTAFADGRAGKLYEDALVRFEKNDVNGALVQLKNALQQDPKMLAGYVLLGKIELARGDAAAAEDAFGRALQLGVSRSEIALPMAQALNDQGKYQELLERFPPESVSGSRRLELLVLRGHAHKGQNDPRSAAQSFEAALAVNPRYSPAVASLSDLLAEQGKRAEATKLVDAALALAPGDARIWNLKGSLAHGAGDRESARAAYSKALALDSSHLDARIARASLSMELQRFDEAEQDIAELRKIAPAEPRANYIRAVFLAQRGDRDGARDALNQTTAALDAVPREVLKQRAPLLLLVGGLAHYSLAQHEKTRGYLEEYLRVYPGHAGARKVLGSALLAQQDYQGAISVLEPAAKGGKADAQAYTLLAAALMGRRQYASANEYLERALRASGEAPAVRAELGLSLLGTGQTDAALDHLQQAFRKDPGQDRAGVALAVLYLKRGQAKQAIEVMEMVTRRDPKNVSAQNLLGLARAGAGDLKGSRAAYEKAITLDKGFVPAHLNLARLDAAEGDHARARARLEALLKDRPKDMGAMIDLAEVEETAGRREEAIRWLEKARALNRRNLLPSTRLVDLYVRNGEPDKALAVAKESEAADPENLTALAALARAYIALGDEKAAPPLLNRMARIAAFDPAWQTQIAAYQLAVGNHAGASASLDKAFAGKADYLPAQILQAEAALRAGDLAAAERSARAIAARYPNQAVGHRLLGDVAVARRDYAGALKAYQVALGEEESTPGALRIFDAHLQSGNTKKAIEFIESWLKTHPKDGLAMRAAGDAQLQAGNLGAARAWYEQVLKLQGDDPAVLNNLANVLLRQSDRAALAHAERAHGLAPKSASIQDTLGWILVQQGQLESGLRHLREARLRSPDNPEIRYHLAAALAKAGRKDEARQELEPALKDHGSFESAQDARQLLQALSTK
jgi:putative PEP-CTERM system TPR-repeat lipoprotein